MAENKFWIAHPGQTIARLISDVTLGSQLTPGLFWSVDQTNPKQTLVSEPPMANLRDFAAIDILDLSGCFVRVATSAKSIVADSRPWPQFGVKPLNK